MINTIRLLLTFYKTYFIASFLITCCCLYIYTLYGIRTFMFLFWFKILTLGLIYSFISIYKKKEFYYYQNLGVSKALLWATTITIDIALFGSLIILAHKLR